MTHTARMAAMAARIAGRFAATLTLRKVALASTMTAATGKRAATTVDHSVAMIKSDVRSRSEFESRTKVETVTFSIERAALTALSLTLDRNDCILDAESVLWKIVAIERAAAGAFVEVRCERVA